VIAHSHERRKQDEGGLSDRFSLHNLQINAQLYCGIVFRGLAALGRVTLRGPSRVALDASWRILRYTSGS
jgi:hypothetical protein